MVQEITTGILSLTNLLTPQRLRYPYLIGAALWFGWCLSLAAGFFSGGHTDRFGQLIGTDFAAFYSAGKIVLEGKADQLYNPAVSIQIQSELYGKPPDQFNPYLNPPFFALLFVPFALLLYPASPILWMALNLCFFVAALWILGIRIPRHYLLALTWLPAWSAISFGQNAFLSLLILSCGYKLWKTDRKLLSGLVYGLLLYKPQLLIGVVILWLIDYRKSWPSLLGLTFSAIAVVGLSLAVSPQATWNYLSYTQLINSALLTANEFPIWNAHGIQTFWIGLLPGLTKLSQFLYLFCIAGNILIFYKFSRQSNPPTIKFALAIGLTVCTTPYLMVYDWSILILPAVIMWQEKPDQQPIWKILYSFLWITMLVSSALTALEFHYLRIALQLSVPVFEMIFIYVLKFLGTKPAAFPHLDFSEMNS